MAAFFLTAPRPPDYLIGADGSVYLERWWLIPCNRIMNIYLHHFLRSDDYRALHDHPWCNLSLLLSGSYIEHLPARTNKTSEAMAPLGVLASAAAVANFCAPSGADRRSAGLDIVPHGSEDQNVGVLLSEGMDTMDGIR